MLMARAGSVVVTTPGAIKSMLLFYLDLLLNVREKGTNEPLLRASRSFGQGTSQGSCTYVVFEREAREFLFFHVSNMSPELQESHSYHSLIPQENHSKNQRSNAHIIMMNT